MNYEMTHAYQFKLLQQLTQLWMRINASDVVSCEAILYTTSYYCINY